MLFRFRKIFLIIWECWFTMPRIWLPYIFVPCSFRNLYARSNSSVRSFFIEEPHHTLVTDLTQSEEEIFKTFSSTIRNEIRRSCSFTFSLKETSKDLIEFYDSFAEAKGINKIANRIWKYPPGNVTWTVAELEGQLLAVHAFIIYQGRARLLYSGNARYLSDESKSKNLIPLANKQLHWFDLTNFKHKGYQTYDWGGIDDTLHPGVATFKRSFGGRDTTVYNYNSWPLQAITLSTQWLQKIKGAL